MKARDFYNKSFIAYEERFKSPTMGYCRKREEKLFRKHARGRILDLGCGTGFWTGKCFLGLDASEEMLRIAKERSRNLLAADIKRIPIKSGSFDSLVLFFSVLSRKDLGEAAPEMNRVLRKGGMLLLSLPSIYDNSYSYSEKKRLRNPKKSKVYHVCGHKSTLDLFGKEEVVRLFSKEGFTLEEFDSAFRMQKPRWGNWKPWSFSDKMRLLFGRLLPKELGCTYFFVFKKG